MANACPGPRTTWTSQCCAWLIIPPDSTCRRMILAGQLESHHRPCYLNPTSAKCPDYPPITSKPTTGVTGSSPPLPANFSHPFHSLTQGRQGLGLRLPRSHLLQDHRCNTGKHRTTQNTCLKPRKCESILQIHLSYCLRWCLFL